MSYACDILRDSISEQGHRLTTFQVTFPRFILAEVNTHRMLSRNSASSRAIPIDKSVQAIIDDMFVPKAFGANQKGMQAEKTLDDYNSEYAAVTWGSAGHSMINHAEALAGHGVHKAWANRLLEPFKWHTAIVTATEWSNFFALRDHPDAQPEFQEIAHMMRETMEASTPELMRSDGWHLPLVDLSELASRPAPLGPEPSVLLFKPDWAYWIPVCIGRCARVSVEQHDGTRDPEADIGLHNRLLENRHLSPFEHAARPFTDEEWAMVAHLQNAAREFWASQSPGRQHEVSKHMNYLNRLVQFQGNLRGWHSARMEVPFEHDFSIVLA